MEGRLVMHNIIPFSTQARRRDLNRGKQCLSIVSVLTQPVNDQVGKLSSSKPVYKDNFFELVAINYISKIVQASFHGFASFVFMHHVKHHLPPVAVSESWVSQNVSYESWQPKDIFKFSKQFCNKINRLYKWHAVSWKAESETPTECGLQINQKDDLYESQGLSIAFLPLKM